MGQDADREDVHKEPRCHVVLGEEAAMLRKHLKPLVGMFEQNTGVINLSTVRAGLGEC